jgi:hypothetical protein
MAEVTIKIKDIPGGKVSVEISPNFETIMKMNLSGENLTSAQAYGVYAVRQIREEAKRATSTIIHVPQITGL